MKIKPFLILMIPLFLTACDKEEVLLANNIPDEISDFILTHFPDKPVSQATKEIDGLQLTYSVILDGGFSLEFNRKKEVVEIKGPSRLPDSVIPDRLLEYISSHFPANFIVEWDLDDRHQQIKLDNDLELEFKLNGDFLRIDH